MVRYGGPRFEFYFTHQYLNNEQMIRKEDAQRVAAIVHGREQAAARLERQREQERAAAASLEAPAASPGGGSGGAAPLSARAARAAAQQRRLCELAAPAKRAPPLRGYGLAGRVMYPRAKGVTVPRGRDDGDYMPGVDRHRIVPHVDLGGRAPWIGSGVEWMAEEAAERAERRFLFEKSKRTAAEARETADRVAAIDRYHRPQTNKETTDTAQAEECKGDGQGDKGWGARGDAGAGLQSDRPPSVFSHASSNAPIRALGTRHMVMPVEKSDVQRHLELYGGQITKPRHAARPPTPFEKLTLPGITERLVRMQKRMYS